MSNTIIQFAQGASVPPLIPDHVDCLSDEECLARLANALTRGDSDHLDELAQLIGRLAVVIE